MLYLKKVGRVLIITLFIVCAAFGMGIFGINYRERFMNKENRIELVENKDDEDDEEKSGAALK